MNKMLEEIIKQLTAAGLKGIEENKEYIDYITFCKRVLEAGLNTNSKMESKTMIEAEFELFFKE